MTTVEVTPKGNRVALVLWVTDDDAGGCAAAGVQLVADEARDLVNKLGEAIADVSRTGVMT